MPMMPHCLQTNKTKPSHTSRSASAMGPRARVGGQSAWAYNPGPGCEHVTQSQSPGGGRLPPIPKQCMWNPISQPSHTSMVAPRLRLQHTPQPSRQQVILFVTVGPERVSLALRSLIRSPWIHLLMTIGTMCPAGDELSSTICRCQRQDSDVDVHPPKPGRVH